MLMGRFMGRAGGFPRSRLVALGGEFALVTLVFLLSHLLTRFVYVFWAFGAYGAHPSASWLIAGGAVLPVLVRRRLPALAVVAAAIVFAWFPLSAAALTVTAFGAASRISSGRRVGAVLVVACGIPLGVAMVASGLQFRAVFVAFGFGVVVCVLVPGMLARLLRQRERLVVALRQQAEYLRRNHELADSAARLQERSRIAEEMHDVLGHRLSLISLYAGALELGTVQAQPAGLSTPPVGEEARLIRRTVAGAMDELRRLLGVLRQDGHDGVSTQPAELAGGRADITDLVAQSQAAGVAVDLRWSGGDLDDAAPTTRRAVHRVVREGLTNVHRHAAGAGARVVVQRGPAHVRIEVANGTARPPRRAIRASGGGWGLVGVQERVRLLGGDFQARPTADGGFLLTTEIPLEPGSPVGPAATAADEASLHPVGAGGRSAGDRWVALATAAVLSTAIGGSVAIVNLAFADVWLEQAPYDPAADRPRVGMTRTEALRWTGTGDAFIGSAARGVEPARLLGTQCIYQVDGATSSDGVDGQRSPTPVWPVKRYCFQGDRLVEIIRFDLPEPRFD